MSKSKIEEILTRRLKLKEPRFYLTKDGDHVFGSIISASFRRRGDLKRQRMIHDALETEVGKTAAGKIGMLLAYTPEEWDWDSVPEPVVKTTRRRAS